MEILGLGPVTHDADLDWHFSQPIPVPMLDGKPCQIVVECYNEDDRKEEFHAAIANFLAQGAGALKIAEPHIFQYYQDCKNDCPEDLEDLVIPTASEVWNHVRLGGEPNILRRPYGDKGVYVLLECGCDWEPEHGLELVFKNGESLCKVGPFDGHLTNSDAYGDESLENVIYHSPV